MFRSFIILIISAAAVLQAKIISLQQAQNSALEKNYAYAIAKESVKYNEFSVKSAFSGFLPTASLSASYLLYTPEVEMSSMDFTTMSPVTLTQDDRTAFGLRITQPVYTGGKIWYSYQISRDSEIASRNTLNSEMIGLLSDVESNYLDVLEAKERLRIAKESLDLSSKNEETAGIKFDSGLISRADYLKNSSARANSEVGLVNAEKGYELAKISFANLTGLDDFELEDIDHSRYEPLITKLSSSQFSDISDKISILKDIASENNSDLKNIKLTKDINEKKISMSAGNFMPSVSLSYSTEWSKTNLSDEFSNSGTVSLSASVPVLPLHDNYVTLQKSRIDLKKTELTEKQLTDNISAQIKTYIYTIVSGSKQFTSSKIAVELANETYMNVEERANSGLSTEDELNTARLALIQAKYDQTSAYYSILKTKSALMKVLGITDEEEIIKLF